MKTTQWHNLDEVPKSNGFLVKLKVGDGTFYKAEGLTYFPRLNDPDKIFGPFKSLDDATSAYKEYLDIKMSHQVA